MDVLDVGAVGGDRSQGSGGGAHHHHQEGPWALRRGKSRGVNQGAGGEIKQEPGLPHRAGDVAGGK